MKKSPMKRTFLTGVVLAQWVLIWRLACRDGSSVHWHAMLKDLLGGLLLAALAGAVSHLRNQRRAIKEPLWLAALMLVAITLIPPLSRWLAPEAGALERILTMPALLVVLGAPLAVAEYYELVEKRPPRPPEHEER